MSLQPLSYLLGLRVLCQFLLSSLRLLPSPALFFLTQESLLGSTSIFLFLPQEFLLALLPPIRMLCQLLSASNILSLILTIFLQPLSYFSGLEMLLLFLFLLSYFLLSPTQTFFFLSLEFLFAFALTFVFLLQEFILTLILTLLFLALDWTAALFLLRCISQLLLSDYLPLLLSLLYQPLTCCFPYCLAFIIL